MADVNHVEHALRLNGIEVACVIGDLPEDAVITFYASNDRII